MENMVKEFLAITKGINEATYTVDAVLSDDSLDRDRDIILLSAHEKDLEKFIQRPVFASSHRTHRLLDGMGKWEDIKLTKSALTAKAKYFVEEERALIAQGAMKEPEVQWGFALAKNGLAAYSINFIAHELIWRDQLDEMPDEIIPRKIKRQEPMRVFTRVEIVETSQVLIPANANAVQRYADGEGGEIKRALAKGAIEKGLITLPRKHFYIPDYWKGDGFVRIDPERREVVETLDTLPEGEKALSLEKAPEEEAHLSYLSSENDALRAENESLRAELAEATEYKDKPPPPTPQRLPETELSEDELEDIDAQLDALEEKLRAGKSPEDLSDAELERIEGALDSLDTSYDYVEDILGRE